MYVKRNTWWLDGPKKPCGLGQVMTCADGTNYTTMGGCDDGSIPTCPSGFTLGNNGPGGTYSCGSSASTLIGSQAAAYVSPNATPLCPSGATCTIIAGIANNYIYLGGAVLGSLLLIGLLKR